MNYCIIFGEKGEFSWNYRIRSVAAERAGSVEAKKEKKRRGNARSGQRAVFRTVRTVAGAILKWRKPSDGAFFKKKMYMFIGVTAWK